MIYQHCKQVRKGLIIGEFIVCFGWIVPLWTLGVMVFGSGLMAWLIPPSFSLSELLTGIAFILWFIAGGIGIGGMISLLSYLLSDASQHPSWKTYSAIAIGIIAATILIAPMVKPILQRPSTYIRQDLGFAIWAAAPFLCSLHFIWLARRRKKR